MVKYPSHYSEFEIQATLLEKLKSYGYHVRGEVPCRRHEMRGRFDLALFSLDFKILCAIEVKHYTDCITVEQEEKYRYILNGTPLLLCYGLEEIDKVVLEIRERWPVVKPTIIKLKVNPVDHSILNDRSGKPYKKHKTYKVSRPPRIFNIDNKQMYRAVARYFGSCLYGCSMGKCFLGNKTEQEFVTKESFYIENTFEKFMIKNVFGYKGGNLYKQYMLLCVYLGILSLYGEEFFISNGKVSLIGFSQKRFDILVDVIKFENNSNV